MLTGCSKGSTSLGIAVITFLTASERMTFSCGLCPRQRSGSAGSHPESVSTAVPRVKPGHGALALQALVRGSVGREVPSAPAGLRGSLCWGLPLVTTAACPITAGRIGMPRNCPITWHHGPCRAETHSPVSGGFRNFQKACVQSSCPPRLFTQLPNTGKKIQTQVENRWTSCKGRRN